MTRVGEADKIVNGATVNVFDISDENGGHPTIKLVATYQGTTIEHISTVGAAESTTPVSPEIAQMILDAERQLVADLCVARASAIAAFAAVQ